MATQTYMTTRAVENPIGDGRHNRAKWRSVLDKNVIPAGFVFAVTDNGDIEDRSRAVSAVTGQKAERLRALLLSVATEPLGPLGPVQESVQDVLTAYGPGEVASKLVAALGLSPEQLRSVLAAGSLPKASPAAVARAPAATEPVP